MAQINIQASRSPEIHFQDGMIILDASVDADVYTEHRGESIFLVGLHIVSYSLYLVGGDIYFLP